MGHPIVQDSIFKWYLHVNLDAQQPPGATLYMTTITLYIKKRVFLIYIISTENSPLRPQSSAFLAGPFLPTAFVATFLRLSLEVPSSLDWTISKLLETARARTCTPHPHNFTNSQCHPIPLNRLFSTPALHLVYHRTGAIEALSSVSIH